MQARSWGVQGVRRTPKSAKRSLLVTKWAKKWGVCNRINPRLPKGVVNTPQTVCLRLHQNGKQCDPGHLSNLFYILSGHFDEKNPGYPLT